MKNILILVAILMASLPILAQDKPKEPPAPPEPTQAEKFVQSATNFADTTVYGTTKIKDLPPDGQLLNSFGAEYSQAVASVAGQQTKEISPDVYNNAKYWNMITNMWSGMMSKFNEPCKTDNSSLRVEFAKKSADLTKEFLKDMVYQDTAATNLIKDAKNADEVVNIYKKDFDSLKSQYEANLALWNSDEDPAAQGNHQYFNPLDMLDRTAVDQANTNMGVRAELRYAGAYDKYLNYNIIQLVNRIKSAYSGYSQLQKDMDWFLKVWGQASELNVMAKDGFNVGGDSQMKAVNASYLVNEYGMPAPEKTGQDQATNNTNYDGLNPLTTYALNDASYNNRSYGYYNGNYTTIVVTVANRQYQLYDHLYTSPIVLDMDGDGKLEASNGEYLPHPYKNARLAEFDINGDGFVELTEWVGPNDGLLIAYKKGEDLSANQLFGEAGGYSDGFEKLSLLDANNDKQLAGDELKTLSVWLDKNSNGQIEEGELSSVADLGITSISIDHKNLVASFVQNGTTKKMWDWFPSIFRAKKMK